MVNIYFDKNKNLIVIPTGESENYGRAIMELDIVYQLNIPYSDEQLVRILKESLSKCFSEKPFNDIKQSALERYLNINGYSRAVKGLNLVVLGWDDEQGYYVTPTNKIPKQGFVSIEDKIISLGMNLDDQILAKAMKEAFRIAI